MKRNRRFFSGILLSLALMLPGLSSAEEEASGWVRLETPGFTIFSNADPETTWQVGMELETLRRALDSWMGGLAARSPMPTSVYVFRDEESFWPYKHGVNADPRNIAGYFLAHPHGNFVAVNGSVGPSPSRVIYHEYLHHFVRHNLPGVPLWFNEGLAELYGSFEVQEQVALVGLPHEGHVAYLRRQGMMPLEELLSIGPDSELYNESARRGVFYAQSWALVHYLMVGDGMRGEQLIHFLDRLAAGVEMQEAFGEAFDMRFSALQEELLEYLAQPELPMLEVSARGIGSTRGHLSRLAPAEVAYRLGDLAAHAAPSRAAFVARHFNRALELEPGHGGAWAGLGYLEDLQGSFDEAVVYYEKSLELAPEDFRAHYLDGRSRLQSLAARGVEVPPREKADLESLERAIEALETSLELHRDFPEALATLGAAWVSHPQPDEGALEVLREARKWLPERLDVTVNLAVLQSRLGFRDQARRLYRQLVEPKADPERADGAREAMARADLLYARDLTLKGELDGARSTLEALLEEDYDLPLAESAQAMLETLEGR